MAVGKSGERVDRDRLSIEIGGHKVARRGRVVPGYDEAPVARQHLLLVVSTMTTRGARGRILLVLPVAICADLSAADRSDRRRFEFWQGRASRLHDRIAFSRENGHGDDGAWTRERLCP